MRGASDRGISASDGAPELPGTKGEAAHHVSRAALGYPTVPRGWTQFGDQTPGNDEHETDVETVLPGNVSLANRLLISQPAVPSNFRSLDGDVADVYGDVEE